MAPPAPSADDPTLTLRWPTGPLRRR